MRGGSRRHRRVLIPVREVQSTERHENDSKSPQVLGRLSTGVGTALAGPPDAAAVRVTALHLPRGLFKGSLPADLRPRVDLAQEIGEEALHLAAS